MDNLTERDGTPMSAKRAARAISMCERAVGKTQRVRMGGNRIIAGTIVAVEPAGWHGSKMRFAVTIERGAAKTLSTVHLARLPR